MRGLFLFLAALVSMVAHGQTNNFDRLNVRESMRVGGVLINQISTDTAFELVSDNAIPTQAAVRAYVDENMRKAAAVVNSISELISYSGPARSVVVKDSLRGGMFYLQNVPLFVDSCITFPATGKGSGFSWQRQWDGSRIMFSWAGIKGDGTDESRHLNRVIQARKRNADTTGVSLVHNIWGTVLLKDVYIERGVSIVAEQVATNNVNAYVPHMIKPAPGAINYIFDFSDDAHNAGLYGLYINADYISNPYLKAAVRFRGAFGTLRDNNIIFCPSHAVWSTAGSFRIENNNFQGMFGPQGFTAWNDFKGALHIIAAGDSYLIGNEIGAASPYLAGQVSNPIDILRDKVNRRVVALYAGYLGNSYVENNLFENGDRGAVIHGAIYGNFKGNRYEMNGGGGLSLRNVYYSTFTDEKFGNNSLACDGCYSDLTLDTGAVAFCTFSHPIFVNLSHPAVPTSTYRVKYNIQNFTGPGGNSLVSPSFDDGRDGTAYCMNGPFDTTIQAAPFLWVEGQYDPANPYYKTVTAGNNKTPFTPYEGFVRLNSGSASTTGSVAFGKANNSTYAIIGGNTGNDLYYQLFGAGGAHQFLGGDMFAQKTGGMNFSLWGLDNTAPTTFRMLSGAGGDKLMQMTLDQTTGDVQMISGGNIKLGINTNLSLAFDGKVSIYPPAPLTGDGVALYRNSATGEIQYGAAPMDSVTAKNRFIQAQWVAKQTANSWYDTAKLVKAIADTVQTPLIYTAGNQQVNKLKTPGNFFFQNGDVNLQKNGSPGMNIQSLDGTGNAFVRFYSDLSQTKIGNIELDRITGSMNYGASNFETHGLVTPGEYYFLNGQMSISKTGQSVLNVISADSTGKATIALAMGTAATKKGYIELDNTNGDMILRGTRDIKLGGSDNLLLKNNGLTYIPTVPTAGNVSSSYLLGRNTSTGEQVIIDPAQLKDAGNMTSGVLPVARGGTGLGSLGTAGQQMRVNAGGTGLEYFTPSAAGESTGTVYGDGTMTSFPTGVSTLILRPTADGTIDLSTGASYPGSANRVAVIVNFTNYSYLIHGVTVTAKIVYAAWDASGSFIGFTPLSSGGGL